MNVSNYLIFSTMIFCISILGMILNRNHLILLFIYIKLMLLAVNTNFILYAKLWNDINGQIMVLFILAVSTAQIAIALAMLVKLYRSHKITDISGISSLKD